MTAKELQDLRKAIDELKNTRSKLVGKLEEKKRRRDELERQLREAGIDPATAAERLAEWDAELSRDCESAISAVTAELARRNESGSRSS